MKKSSTQNLSLKLTFGQWNCFKWLSFPPHLRIAFLSNTMASSCSSPRWKAALGESLLARLQLGGWVWMNSFGAFKRVAFHFNSALLFPSALQNVALDVLFPKAFSISLVHIFLKALGASLEWFDQNICYVRPILLVKWKIIQNLG